jgi:two-component system, OmpR family, sensor kinase
MKIINYVYVLLMTVAMSVLLLGFIAIFAIDQTNYFRTRADLASTQERILIDLSRSANHLSEHVLEHFLFKQVPLEEIRSSQRDANVALEKLRLATADEISHLRSRDEVAVEQDDAVRLEQFETLLKAAGRQIEEMLQFEAEGKAAEAIQHLESGFKSQTMRQFESIIAVAIEEESGEALLARRAADDYWIWIRQMAILAVGFLLLVTVLLGFGFIRRLNQPIAEISEGANAFAAGNLEHQIKIRNKDELGALAGRFNEMAKALAASRAAQLEAQAELERKIEDRTADLRQKAIELDKVNSQLTHVNKNRIQFLADISHEVRTPLTTLRGEAELALRSKFRSPGPYRLALSISETIGKLVDDLLFLARSETDSLRFEQLSINLTDIVHSVLDDASILAKTKSVVIRKMFEEKLPVQMEGDPVRIRQALLIALDNAIKYSPPEKNVDFVMSTTHQMADFTIRDFGPGVAKEDLPYVFERFYRSKREAGLPGGFGLGLSIAKWIVDKHGGTISLQCQKGIRTELKISFPLIHAESRARD